MSKPLQGRVVIVTGAAGGIGRACAITLAEAGARLGVTDIVDCDETVAAIHETEGEAAFVKADIGVESDGEELAARSGRARGRRDGAVTDAGVEPCATALP